MYTILAVDDEIENLELVEYALKDGFDVVPVKSGEMALKYLSGNRPDLILLDIRMPLMDGIEVYRRIQEQESMQDIPVIFLTSANDVETEDSCFEMGAVDFISKPFEPQIVRRRIKRTLELIVKSAQGVYHAIEQKEEENSFQGKTLNIVCNGMQVALFQKDIYYIEVFNNTCIIRTVNRELSVRETLEHIQDKLCNQFIRVGRSYVVNTKYVTEIKDDILVMQSGKLIKLPRRNKKDIIQQIMTIHHKS